MLEFSDFTAENIGNGQAFDARLRFRQKALDFSKDLHPGLWAREKREQQELEMLAMTETQFDKDSLLDDAIITVSWNNAYGEPNERHYLYNEFGFLKDVSASRMSEILTGIKCPEV